jgi:hypothetical protein
MKQTTIKTDKSSEDPLSWAFFFTGLLLLVGAIATIVIDVLLSSLPPEAPQVPIDNPGEQSEFTPAPSDEPTLG